MDPGVIERLLVRQGEEAGPEKVRRLESLIARQGLLNTPGVRLRKLPWGIIPSFRSTSSAGGTSPIFTPTVTRRGRDGFLVSWERGLIDGVEPQIDGVPISGARANGEAGKPPVFFVPSEAFKDGEAKVYFRGTIALGWIVTKLVPFASPEVPKTRPWSCDKLALLLFADGTFWRALYANQGHLAINRRTDGTAQHLFWSKQ